MIRNQKYKVIISAPYLQREFENYKQYFISKGIDCILPKVVERMNEEEILTMIKGVDGIICGDDSITKKVIDQADKLKVVVKWGTGIDSIDKDYLIAKGIKLFNTPGAFNQPVSDTIMGYILVFARRLLESDGLMKSGEWKKPMGKTLCECSLGIIGVGNVGQALAEKANFFSMELFGNDIIEIPDQVTGRYNIKMVSKQELLQKSDFVSINCDLNPTSYQLIGRDELHLMKNDAYLINTARGPVINEKSLNLALSAGEIAGAALDVFEQEPLAVDSPLRGLPNIILSSHNANCSPEYWKRVHLRSIKILLDNILVKGG